MAGKKLKVIDKKPMTIDPSKLTPVSLKDYIKNTANTHKIISYGETNTGKTRAWMKILEYCKRENISPEKVLVYVIYPDRATGITKIASTIPKEYIEQGSVMICDVRNYEELVGYTKMAFENLERHFNEVSPHAWLVIELLGVPWVYAQDFYTRQAYGEELGNYFAERKQLSKAVREDSSAYKAIDGWKDWPVIKFFHNFQWIDKIKLMPFNIWVTAEEKPVGDEKSQFYKTGRPGGEKDNIHRFDEVLHFSRTGDTYFMEPIKLTGYSKKYPKVNITNKNPFMVHLQKLETLEKSGHRDSPVDMLEKSAGIKVPQKPPETPKKVESVKVPEKVKEVKKLEEKPKEIKKVEPKVTKIESVKIDGEFYIYRKHFDDDTSKLFKRKATEEDKKKFSKPVESKEEKKVEPKVESKAEPKVESKTESKAEPKKEEKKESSTDTNTLDW